MLRLVLINAADVAKVADFGLSRNMDKNDYYRGHTDVLPIRWTALEVGVFHVRTQVANASATMNAWVSILARTARL